MNRYIINGATISKAEFADGQWGTHMNESATDNHCTYIWTTEDNDRAQTQNDINDFLIECAKRGAVVTGLSFVPFATGEFTWYLASVVYRHFAEIVL